MNADEFVEIVRKGSDKLRVDGIVLKTGERELHGKGMLRIEREKMELAITFDVNEQMPPNTGIFTKRDFWKVSGLIEDHLKFKCDAVTPSFELCTIDLVPTGDAMPTEELTDPLKQDQQRIGKQKNVEAVDCGGGTAKTSVVKDLTEVGTVRFEAMLAGYPLLFHNSGTKIVKTNDFLGESYSGKTDTFKGEFSGFDFALMEDNTLNDLRVVLKSKEGYQSSGEQEDWRKYNAFLQALAFTHGMHAWP